MTTPTKEQIKEILGQMNRQGWYWDSIDYEDEYAVLRFVITEWEMIRCVNNNKKLSLELGKEYITESGREVKIVYVSNCRATPYLGVIKEKEGMPDAAIWYNPDGTHNEQWSGITITKGKDKR